LYFLKGGTVMSKTATKPITARVTQQTYEQLERLAEKKQIKKYAIITLALEEYAKKEERNENGK